MKPANRLPPVPYLNLNSSLSTLTLSTQEAFMKNCSTITSFEFKNSSLSPNYLKLEPLSMAPVKISQKLVKINAIPILLPGKSQKIKGVEKGKYAEFQFKFKDQVLFPMKFFIINTTNAHFLVFVNSGRPASKVYHLYKFYQEIFQVPLRGFSAEKPVFVSIFALTRIEELIISFEFVKEKQPEPRDLKSKILGMNTKSLNLEVERILAKKKIKNQDNLIRSNIENSKIYMKLRQTRIKTNYEEKLEKVRSTANRNFLITQREFLYQIIHKITRKAEAQKETEIREKKLLFLYFQANWFLILNQNLVFDCFWRHFQHSRYLQQLEDKRNHAAQLLQKKYKVFLIVKYANLMKSKELTFLFGTIKSLGILRKKSRKKAKYIVARVLQAAKAEFNFRIYMERICNKVVKIQRIFRQKDLKNRERLNILRDIWDKTVIRMIKNEIAESAEGKKSKKGKKKSEKDAKKIKKLQGITKQMKDQYLNTYYQSKVETYRGKIKNYLNIVRGLSREQQILSAFLKNAASSKRNSLFGTKIEPGKEIKMDYGQMNEKCNGLQNIKKPEFEFLLGDEEMEKLVEDALEKIIV